VKNDEKQRKTTIIYKFCTEKVRINTEKEVNNTKLFPTVSSVSSSKTLFMQIFKLNEVFVSSQLFRLHEVKVFALNLHNQLKLRWMNTMKTISCT
jgi:hypothetical protein